MIEYTLNIHLLSDATFGRGDGVAGLVDTEVQHDDVGLPYLGGRALKGLLAAECADLVYALSKQGNVQADRWTTAAEQLFGHSGATLTGEALMRVGPAQLPRDLHDVLAQDIVNRRISRADVLETLTTLRRQTAMDESGAPRKKTLRTLRVILRDTMFSAQLAFATPPSDDALALLSATVKALRRAGTGRNRGRGKLQAALYDARGESVTDVLFERFRKAVTA